MQQIHPLGGGINIMTSDDGLGDPIELSRLVFLKILNQNLVQTVNLIQVPVGSYRQLVGNYSTDGGYDGFDPSNSRLQEG